jgi:type II secretory pathway pseudopilin PulG
MTLKASYTLIELCIVLAIMTILCLLSVPMIVNNDDRAIVRELDKLEAVFLYLHQRAIATQFDHELTIDINQNTYSYKIPGRHVTFKLPTNIMFGWLPSALGPPGNPTTPIIHACSFPIALSSETRFAIRFISNGQFYPGALYLIDGKKRFMGALTCSISRLFYIRKYLYRSGQWFAHTT